MRVTDEERAMLAGEAGEPRRWAIRHQIAVGEFFDAADLVPVSQAHVMADTESLGDAGVRFLEGLATAPEAARRIRIPTLTDPRGLDFQTYKRLGQTDAMAALEARAIAALRSFGVLMTDTCINYQTILPPTRGEHLAMGDTGVVIYSNSVFGARSNFEGGPSALAAALTGRTPRFGYHLDGCRRATRHFRIEAAPRDLSQWGALGGIIGRDCGSYWEVPLVEGLPEILGQAPGSDALKHFGAAMASYGSTALFHMPGVTPEAEGTDRGRLAMPSEAIGRAELDAFIAAYGATGDKVDVVVFAAPHLSLVEMAAVADALAGRAVHLTRRCLSQPRPRSSTPPTAWV